MIKGGYYIKARCIQDSEISKAPPYIREIWDWILKECNHKDTNICKRGQTIRSFNDIIEGLSWYVGWRKNTYKKDHCEKAMKWLKKATMIDTTKTTRGMLITVLNYDKYQDPKNYESDNEDNSKATGEQQNLHTINKNDKNEKNDNNKERDTPETEEDKLVKTRTQELFNYIHDHLNPNIDYGDFKQRSVAKSLAKRYMGDEGIGGGFDYLMDACEIVFTNKEDPFCPRIYNLYDLKEKIEKIKDYYNRINTKE